jgi:hypothetical protein
MIQLVFFNTADLGVAVPKFRRGNTDAALRVYPRPRVFHGSVDKRDRITKISNQNFGKVQNSESRPLVTELQIR